MARVIGIGGVFFKSKSPKKLCAWYRKNLGLDVETWGGAQFPWDDRPKSDRKRSTVWSPFPEDSTYFAPSRERYLINFIVEGLDGLMAKLRRARVKIDPKGIEASDFGRFAWVFDPEGRKLELWEPPLRKRKSRR